jgi:hypothetical protein
MTRFDLQARARSGGLPKDFSCQRNLLTQFLDCFRGVPHRRWSKLLRECSRFLPQPHCTTNSTAQAWSILRQIFLPKKYSYPTSETGFGSSCDIRNPRGGSPFTMRPKGSRTSAEIVHPLSEGVTQRARRPALSGRANHEALGNMTVTRPPSPDRPYVPSAHSGRYEPRIMGSASGRPTTFRLTPSQSIGLPTRSASTPSSPISVSRAP